MVEKLGDVVKSLNIVGPVEIEGRSILDVRSGDLYHQRSISGLIPELMCCGPRVVHIAFQACRRVSQERTLSGAAQVLPTGTTQSNLARSGDARGVGLGGSRLT